MTDKDDGPLSVAEQIKELKAVIASMAGKLDETLAKFADLPLRVSRLEYVVYGGCSVVLLAVLGALIAVVVKSA
jgi:hypothetical protein